MQNISYLTQIIDVYSRRCLILINEFDHDEDGVPREISSFIHQQRFEVLLMMMMDR